MGFLDTRPIKTGSLKLLAISVFSSVAVFYPVAMAQQVTPSDLEAGASSTDSQAVFQRQSTGSNPGTTGGGSATDSDNAIEVGDYARAEAVAAERLKTVQGGVAEIALRLSLIEAKMWQGKFQTLPKELKIVSSMLNKTPNVSPNLMARYLDDQSWMTQIGGDAVKAEVQAREAIANWKKAEQTDISFLCGGIDHLAHLLEDRGAFAEATKWYQESLALHAKAQGPRSVACANQMERIGALAFRNGNPALAQKMYADALAIKEGTRAVLQQFAPQKAEDAVFYRFLPGAPNVSRETADGVTREKITANGVTVEAALLTKGADVLKNSKAMVRITNNGDSPISVLPQGPDLIILKPRIQLAKQVQGETLAQTIEKKGESKAKWIRFWGSQATTTSTTNVIGNGAGFFPYGGYMSPNFGYGGPMGYGGNSWYNNSGGMTTMMTSMPDFQARERAYQRAQAVSDQTQRQAADVRDSELGPTTLNPMGRIVGCLFYDQNNFDEATLRIPIGKAVFEFRFDHLR
jgi:tetratricopeptide (TPR) repeat protein